MGNSEALTRGKNWTPDRLLRSKMPTVNSPKKSPNKVADPIRIRSKPMNFPKRLKTVLIIFPIVEKITPIKSPSAFKKLFPPSLTAFSTPL